MQQLPQHKAYALSDLGIRLRRVVPLQGSDAPVTYSHQDDFYIIGLVEKGTGCGMIDFKKVTISQGDLFLIQPRQVHRFIGCSTDVAGWMLFADSSYVGGKEQLIFGQFQLFASSVKIDKRRMDEPKQMASLLADRMDCGTDELAKTIARKLAEAYIGMVAASVRDVGLRQIKHSHRHVEIVLSFLHLLTQHIAANRSPSYYASLLNISPVYLNEAVKKVTGMSATLYIKNELILQAKRLLVHTGLTVKEISNQLGVDDYAYFSRIFTQMAGVSPSAFRQKNLE